MPQTGPQPQSPTARPGGWAAVPFAESGQFWGAGGEAVTPRQNIEAMLGRELDEPLGREITSRVEGSGRITVDVNAPRGTTVGAEAGGLFREVEMNRMTQMSPSAVGPVEEAKTGD
jgi:hypothetical protein